MSSVLGLLRVVCRATGSSSVGTTTAEVGGRTVLIVASFLRALTWRDWALPAALLVGAQLEIWARTAVVVGPRWALALAALGAGAALVGRRRYPLVSLVFVLGVLACPLAFGWVAQSIAMVLMVGVALFACGR